MLRDVRNVLGPLLLILLCPPFVMMIWYANTELGGSLWKLMNLLNQNGVLQTTYDIWKPYFWGSSTAWCVISGFIVFELALMRLLPGKTFHGPITPNGNVPVYKINGVLAFITTLSAFCIASFGLGLFPATILYDNLGHILGALNIFSLVFCGLLYLKGRFYPSSTDSGTTNNILFDYYWGLLLSSYCAKQEELGGISNSMLISVALQLLYIAKFFMWEHGYLRSLDIMHDRAGFYICWGCLVWVPCVYTSPSMYLVLHPVHLSTLWATIIFSLGAISIIINYLADRQRLLTRATEGDCKIWGKPPVTLLARYKTDNGHSKQTILLASGWWGIARHFHYVPELAGAFFWSVPALFNNFSPYFYVCFLTILLFDRAFRDDKRCAKKYGDDWSKYCEVVPYKIVPFVI